MIERNLAYNNWKRHKTVDNKAQYKRLRNIVNSMINNAKATHDRQKLNLNLPSKQLWNNIKKLGISPKESGTLLGEHSENAINDYFSSNFTSCDSGIIRHTTNDNGFCFRPTLDHEIVNAIFNIKSNAVGFDGIPIKFLRIILPLALPVLEHLFNAVLAANKFPAEWKRTKIVPITKKPNVNAITNLRPISLLPAGSKVFEKLLKDQMMDYINRLNFIHPFQSGFRSLHSTETALLKVHDDIARSIDKNGVTILLLIDFAKAFDRVVHSKLINKLISQFNFSNSAVKLIGSYLAH